MALELQADSGGRTGLTAYFIVSNTVGLYWNGSAFAAYSTAVRNAGAITATGLADGTYQANAPAFAAGLYFVRLYQRIGGSPAESDTLLCGPGELQWNGTAVVPTGTLNTGAITDATITTPAEAAGVPSTLLAMIRRMWEKRSNRRTRDRTSGVYTLYGADNTTPLETSTQSTASSVDTETKAASV
jgi:hypothetical protein